jgi:hypothetical protein
MGPRASRVPNDRHNCQAPKGPRHTGPHRAGHDYKTPCTLRLEGSRTLDFKIFQVRAMGSPPKGPNLLHLSKANRLRAYTPSDKDGLNSAPPHMGWLDWAASVQEPWALICQLWCVGPYGQRLLQGEAYHPSKGEPSRTKDCTRQIDSEALLVTDFMNLKIKSAQSFRCAQRGRVCVRVFMGVSARTCMRIYVCTVFLKK